MNNSVILQRMAQTRRSAGNGKEMEEYSTNTTRARERSRAPRYGTWGQKPEYMSSIVHEGGTEYAVTNAYTACRLRCIV